MPGKGSSGPGQAPTQARRSTGRSSTRSTPADETADTGQTSDLGEAAAEQAERTAATLSYNEARTALDLILAELQSSDLPVERMAGLHRRAQAYAQRCEQVLEQVEQEILIWDPNSDADPLPYTP